MIKIFKDLLPTAKGLLTRIENVEQRNDLKEVVDASEFICQKLQSGNQADINELKGYLNQRHATTAGYVGRLILGTKNALEDLSKKRRAGAAAPQKA